MYRSALKMQAAEVLDLVSLSLIRFSFMFKICLMLFIGGVCGQLLEYRGSSFASRVVSLGKELHYPFFHCSSRCINGTGDIQLAGNPEMDQHPVQRGEAILLNMLHAEETGLTSNRLHLWLVCALTLRYLQWSLHDKLTKGYFIRTQCQISQRHIY